MQVQLIDERTYAHDMETRVLPALDACCVEGWMSGAAVEGLDAMSPDGMLHYICYDAMYFDALCEDGATARFRGAIVISHGFTEFAAKYAELIWYFLLAGYSVCILEHRGHGYSARDISNPSLVWIDDWRRYVADLALFARTIGRQYAVGRPLSLFAHSMGGGIGAALLEQHPTLFDKAVLSSPMIAPATGMPNWLATALTEPLATLGLSDHRVIGHHEFTPELDMSAYRGASEARVRWYHQWRCRNECYQTYAATFEWVRQSLRLSRAVQRRSACAKIETPILLCQAGRDVWVLNEPQNRFAERVSQGGADIRLVRFDDALHEIFSMPNAMLRGYLDQVLGFFAAAENCTLDD